MINKLGLFLIGITLRAQGELKRNFVEKFLNTILVDEKYGGRAIGVYFRKLSK